MKRKLSPLAFWALWLVLLGILLQAHPDPGLVMSHISIGGLLALTMWTCVIAFRRRRENGGGGWGPIFARLRRAWARPPLRREAVCGPLANALPLWGLILLSLATTLLIAGTASAQDAPDPPGSVVLNVYNVTGYDGPGDHWIVRYNLTFQLSPSDPDPINGALNYTRYTYGNGNPLFNAPLALTIAPVPSHPGWVMATADMVAVGCPTCTDSSTDGLRDASFFNVIVTANDTTVPGPQYGESIPSCAANLTGTQLRRLALPSPTPRGHAQCLGTGPVNSTNVNGTTGLSVLVTDIGDGTVADPNTDVELTWTTSLSDPLNTTSGNYSYWWIETLSAQPLGPLDCFCAIDTTNTNDANARRQHNFQIASDPQLATYWILVEDPFTRQWSNLSCSVAVSTERFFAANRCGSFGAGVADAPTGTPQFPLLNVTQFTDATGFSTAGALWFLSGALILALGLGGYMAAGPIGGAAAGILSIPLVVVLNLVAEWWMILVFFLAASVLVFFFSRGGD